MPCLSPWLLPRYYRGEACLSVARICLPLALPITGPLAALLQRRSLPLSSENLPAFCPAYHRASCRATTEAKPASQQREFAGLLPCLSPGLLPRYYRGQACLSVARICLPLALPITGPLAALLQRRSLPLSSERLPACLLEKWQKIKANGQAGVKAAAAAVRSL